VTALLWGKTFLETPLYQGSFEALVDSISQDEKLQLPTDHSSSPSSGTLQDSDFETIVRLMQSPKLISSALSSDELKSFDPENLKISRVPNTKMVSVRYTHSDPARIQSVLNSLSSAYLDYSRNRELNKVNEGLQFLEQQFPGLESRVNSLEAELEKFRQKYNFVDPEKQGEELVSQLNNYNQQVRSTEAELIKQRERYQTLQNQIRMDPKLALNAVALSESTRYQNILNELLELDKKIALESARVQPNNPTLLALQEKKAQLKPLLDQQIRRMQGSRSQGSRGGEMTPISLDLAKQLVSSANEIKVLQSQHAILVNQLKMLQSQFEKYPTLARQYQALERKLDVAQANLKNFLEARERLRLEAAQKTIPWEIVSPPLVGKSPVSPNLPRNLGMGLLLGCLAGIGASLLRDRLDHVFHTPQEVKEELKVPLLATLPYMPQRASGVNDVQAFSNRYPSSALNQRYLEACRSLYTNLRLLGADKPIRAIAIGSAIPSEGKSTVATNLARTAVSLGQRVLLIDTDLRRPKLHKRLNLENQLGLSSVLTGSVVLEQAVQRVDDGLSVLTAGQLPPDPVRLLASETMIQLVQKLQSSNEYDLVIFDTPMLLGMADTISFAQLLDGLVMVVSLDKVDRNATKEVIQHLRFANISLLGAVTNAMSENSSPTTVAYGSYHYYIPASDLDDDDLLADRAKQSSPLSRLKQGSRSVVNWVESK
jgi:capsular exopolysaccharide synthesis family protein